MKIRGGGNAVFCVSGAKSVVANGNTAAVPQVRLPLSEEEMKSFPIEYVSRHALRHPRVYPENCG